MRRPTLREQLAAVTAERDAWKAMAEMLAARPPISLAAPIVPAPFQFVPAQTPVVPYTPGIYPVYPVPPFDIICGSPNITDCSVVEVLS